jgi:hypothetical protein
VRKNAKALIIHYSCQTTKCLWRVSGKYSTVSFIRPTAIFCEAIYEGKKERERKIKELALYVGSYGKLIQSQRMRWRGNKLDMEKKKNAYRIDTSGGLL